VPPVRCYNLFFNFNRLTKFTGKNGFDFNKNLEEFRNPFSKIAKSWGNVFFIDSRYTRRHSKLIGSPLNLGSLEDWKTGMGKIDSQEALLATPRGDVRIRSFCSAAKIRQCEFDRQFTFHDHYKSLYTSRELLAKSAEQPDANIVLALAEQKHIIGYAVMAYPGPGERWADLGPQMMIEVKALEVCRSWRSCRIAPAILKMMLVNPQFEEKIIYMVGYSWTWDLKGTGKTAQQYRQMLVKLFKPYGFSECQTNEPNICLRPENLFMCRVGNRVTQIILDRFKWLRFGLSPWTWNVDGRQV
jgi:acetoin utilization protein AcuA